jgi:uncharacterized protein with von Willebrand factor type A (vWA) domain
VSTKRAAVDSSIAGEPGPRTSPPKQESDLVQNLLFFSQKLRDRRVGVTTDNVIDALKSISLIDLQRKKDFYDVLKSNFVSRKEEIAPFDELFEHFWSFEEDRPPSVKESPKPRSEPGPEDEEPEPRESPGKRKAFFQDWGPQGEDPQGRVEEKELPGYSPDEILGRKEFDHLRDEELEKMKEWVLTLSKKLGGALSRRWRKRRAGDLLDLRGSMRHSLKYGGEIIELRMREPKPKPMRIVLLCDVSGSMDIFSQFFLLFMFGLQNHYPDCETFVFSTRLSHVTSLLKRRSFEDSLRLLSARVSDWSGGTNIGEALHQLHHRFPGLYRARRTLFLIFSDGWDRGETALLDAEMKNLKRQVKRILWLNPLLGSKDYQPLCKGMSTALRYLDHFLPCHNLLSLKNMSHLLTRL